MADFSVAARSVEEAKRKINHSGNLHISCVFFETIRQEVIDDAGRKSHEYVRTGGRVYTFNTTI